MLSGRLAQSAARGNLGGLVRFESLAADADKPWPAVPVEGGRPMDRSPRFPRSCPGTGPIAPARSPTSPDAGARASRRHRQDADPAGRSGFEHGPARSFGPNPPAYDPHYHFELALAAGCSAYAAPLGFLEAGARDYAGRIPLILKLNNHDLLADEDDPSRRSPARWRTRCGSAPAPSASRSIPARPTATPCTANPGDRRGGQERRARRGDLVLCEGLGPVEEVRDRHRRDRLRRADRRAARRPHHQGSSCRPPISSSRPPRKSTNPPASRSAPRPSGCATWCNAPSTGGGS